MKWLIAATVLVFSATAALGQQPPVCGPRAQLLEKIEAIKEVQIAFALSTKGGGVLEIYSTEDGSSWTAVVSYPTGTSCVVDYGVNYTVSKALKVPGSDS